jgi:FdhE protein
MKDPQVAAIRRAMKHDPKINVPLGILLGLVTIGGERPGESRETSFSPDGNRLAEGFPLADTRLLPDDLDGLGRRFARLVRVILEGNRTGADEIVRFYEDRARFHDLLSGVLMQQYRFPDTFAGSGPVALLAANETLLGLLVRIGEDAERAGALGAWTAPHCPVCGAAPHLSLIEEEEGRLLLSCSRCFVRYRFRRLACPFCGEAGQKNLRYFTAEGDSIHRVYVCETCRHYLKSVDLKQRPTVFARVEDLITIRLDIVAQREGYVRETVDLVGLILLSDDSPGA